MVEDNLKLAIHRLESRKSPDPLGQISLRLVSRPKVNITKAYRWVQIVR